MLVFFLHSIHVQLTHADAELQPGLSPAVEPPTPPLIDPSLYSSMAGNRREEALKAIQARSGHYPVSPSDNNASLSTGTSFGTRQA